MASKPDHVIMTPAQYEKYLLRRTAAKPVPFINARTGQETEEFKPKTAKKPKPKKSSGLAGKAYREIVGDRTGLDTENLKYLKSKIGFLANPVDTLATVMDVVNGGINAGIGGAAQLVGNAIGADPSKTDRAAGSLVELANIGSLIAGGEAGPRGVPKAPKEVPHVIMAPEEYASHQKKGGGPISQEYLDSLTPVQRAELDAYDPNAVQPVNLTMPSKKQIKAQARKEYWARKADQEDTVPSSVGEDTTLSFPSNGKVEDIRSYGTDELDQLAAERGLPPREPVVEPDLTNVDTSFQGRRQEQLTNDEILSRVGPQHKDWVEENVLGPLNRGEITQGEAASIMDEVGLAADNLAKGRGAFGEPNASTYANDNVRPRSPEEIEAILNEVIPPSDTPQKFEQEKTPYDPQGTGQEPLDLAGHEETPTPEVISRLTNALTSAGKLSKEQVALNSETRSQRIKSALAARDEIGGQEGFHNELSALKGEFPKKKFESISEKFTQPELDGLFRHIRDSDNLKPFETISARAGLNQLLSGALPTGSQLDLLGKVFPKEFIQAAVKNRGTAKGLMDHVADAANLPRALMSSFDLSAPLRQGVFLVGRKEFYKAWPTMFKEFYNGFKKEPEGTWSAVMSEIRERPTYDLMDQAGLALSDMGHTLSNREEAFMSPMAEKIPGIGRVVRASDKAYTGFLNKLRADTFDSLVKLSNDAGIDFNTNPKALKDIASFVNNATGRGSLGSLNKSAPLLNSLFFSPRLIASRVNLLNPAYYIALSPVVRKEAVKSLLSFGAIASTVAGLAAAGGASIETDPRSTDFAKIKTGNTRYDILGGFGQYITLGARLATNERKTQKGEIQELGKEYGVDNRLDVLTSFGVNKFAPVPSFIASYLRGKDPTGQPFDPTSSTSKIFVPLFLQDVYKVIQEEGVSSAPKAVPGLFGVGVNVYTPPPDKSLIGTLPDSPVKDEMSRLAGIIKSKTLVSPPDKSVTIPDSGGERMTLEDDQYKQYLDRSTKYATDYIQQFVLSSPEWKVMSDEDKIKEIRSIFSDARRQARDELFFGAQPPEQQSHPATDEVIMTPEEYEDYNKGKQ